MNTKLSVGVLIGANLIPLGGVLLFDWAVFDVMILYWAENVIIGIINVMRMLSLKVKLGLILIPFFTVHYGMFCFGHYTAVVSLFGDGEWRKPLWFAAAAIAVSHLISFGVNFIGRREYQRTHIAELMRRPYGRIVILHITVIAGGFLVSVLDNPFWMLPVLVAIKTGIDLRMHLAERRVFATETELA